MQTPPRPTAHAADRLPQAADIASPWHPAFWGPLLWLGWFYTGPARAEQDRATDATASAEDERQYDFIP